MLLFIYFRPCDSPWWIFTFYPFRFFYSCTLYRTSFDTSAYYTIHLLWYQCLFKYDDDYIDDADDDDDDADDDDDYYYIITKYLMFKQIYSDQWYNL